MACLSALRKILFSRMTTSSGFTAAADAAASSLVSGVDEDMKERYAAFLTPLMASPTAEKRPFLPKPTGHSPPVAGASLAVSASVLALALLPGAQGAGFGGEARPGAARAKALGAIARFN
jgi:hypothetical protein